MPSKMCAIKRIPARKLLLLAVSVFCLTLLILSIYPGVLSNLFCVALLLMLVIGPVVMIATFALIIDRVTRRKSINLRIPGRAAGVLLAIVSATALLIALQAPRRVAFACSRPAFEAYVDQTPTSQSGGTALNQRLGLFLVNAYAADQRGGVYFTVFAGSEGIGSETTYYGFARRPNEFGTPFGDAAYRVTPLGNDWYWFQATDF